MAEILVPAEGGGGEALVAEAVQVGQTSVIAGGEANGPEGPVGHDGRLGPPGAAGKSGEIKQFDF